MLLKAHNSTKESRLFSRKQASNSSCNINRVAACGGVVVVVLTLLSESATVADAER